MSASTIMPIRWCDDGHLELLDQRTLPDRHLVRTVTSAEEAAAAIREMVVRGAPAIGITAAYGVVLAALEQDDSGWPDRLEAAMATLAASRPTAVNLFWALARMREVMALQRHAEVAPVAKLLEAARAIHRKDLDDNLAMGELGADLIARSEPCAVMTHCNTGALATGGHGTALGVIRSAWNRRLITRVHANETRPWLQGARLTAWELDQEGIPVTLAVDSAASLLMAQGRIGWLIVGADRIAANGDVANKIGTLALAVQARHFGVKVMVVAPSSTFDLEVASGVEIPIECRDASELTHQGERIVAPQGIDIYNPVFDVTPASLIDAIVCERGVIEHPDRTAIARVIETCR
ncbi:methylthioribose-1-phosphate isomerase [Litchfieldella qijiaojingensis]|uniref:Methylthioribose-1-phosphate isomerase n=1 Tax=Litchfieldella qijiaojingensis TaxID=980347 RepID=A0ABQ2YCL3_9GAMM|nr:S-methyl-5-thioribose-1-phosphate isomerase [Halomonas qijiaojingensis]GGX79182.1 methylthioribose-1-phosphate isomerase [Halomonas qijiaojingensis]